MIFSYNGISSVAIHAGNKNFSDSSHLVPIYATSTFTFDTAEQGMERFSGKQEGYIYSRWVIQHSKLQKKRLLRLKLSN
jgi:methionine-gamma-lyase